jgi:chaperonin GroES
MTPETVAPLGSRVLVRILAEDSVTASGLVIPDTAKEKGQKGEVIAVGDDEEMIKVKVGDRVLFAKYAGTELSLGGSDHLLIESNDLLAVIRPAVSEASAA